MRTEATTLRWRNVSVPADGERQLSVGVKTSGMIATEAPFDETTCTIRGTAGDDLLTGTGSRDVICGFGGNDVLASGDGEDRLDGGDGDDRLRAGWSAHERVFCGGGDDLYAADVFNDLLVGCETFWPSEGAS